MIQQADMAPQRPTSDGASAHVLAIAPHYVVNYHPGTLNYCPGCSGTHWLVGRTMAQCARCEAALPLA